MGVPKKRYSKSKVGRRRTHIFLKKPKLTKCSQCGRFILPHSVCSFCGYYKGKEVINVLEKLEKEERKKREREIKEKSREKPLSWKELSKKHGL